MRSLLFLCPTACETPRKLALAAMLAVLLATVAPGVISTAGSIVAASQPGRAAHPEGEVEPAHEEGGSDGPLQIIARLVNFGILAGTLVYLLRSPIAQYLRDRSGQIRADLVNAAEMKKAAAAGLSTGNEDCFLNIGPYTGTF